MSRAGGVGPSVEREFLGPRATALVRNPASLSDEQRDTGNQMSSSTTKPASISAGGPASGMWLRVNATLYVS